MIWRREYVNTFTALGNALFLRGEVLFDPDIALWDVSSRYWTLPLLSGTSCLKKCKHRTVRNVSFSSHIDVISDLGVLHVEPLPLALIAEDTGCSTTSCHVSDWSLPRQVSPDPPPSCSFTDEFLEAIHARNQAPEEIDLQEDLVLTIEQMPFVIRRIHNAFQDAATLTSEDVEPTRKIETWFLDHHIFPQCFQSRVLHLTPSFDQWEQQILHEWRDKIDPSQQVEFDIVRPHPEDAEDGAIIQIILTQRAQPGYSSLVISIYDSAYDNGRPHSYAAVLGHRVSLRIVAVATEFEEFCQPSHRPTDCSLWIEDLQILPHQFVATRHGYAFRFRVRRPLEVDLAAFREYNVDELRNALTLTLEDAATFSQTPEPNSAPSPPIEVISFDASDRNAPWYRSLHDAIDGALILSAMDYDYTALGVETWYLDGNYAPRSLHSRTVQLLADPATWETSIIDAWQDHVDLSTPWMLHFVDPQPPGTRYATHLGHILLLQHSIDHHAALLLSAVWPMNLNREPIHSAVYTVNNLNANQAFNLLPFTANVQSFQVRRGAIPFHATVRQPVDNGDNLVVVILDPARSSTSVDDDTTLFQLSVLHTTSNQPIEISEPSASPAAFDSCRLTDAHYNVPSSWFPSDGPPPEQPQDDPEDANHFLHEAPESVQHLFDALQHEGVVEGPRVSDSIFLRSWFIHHQHEMQGFHYRVIEINGHWRFWYNDITQSWRDHVRPLEQVIFDVVRPDPPRTASTHEFLFDMIVSQGIEQPRRAGLATVLHRDDRAARAAYAIAVSLPDLTSGHQIVQYAEALSECSRYTCNIRHGRFLIPYDTTPTHMMQDGDSFVIAVSSQTSGGASSSAVVTASSGVCGSAEVGSIDRHDFPSGTSSTHGTGAQVVRTSETNDPLSPTSLDSVSFGLIENKPNSHGEVILNDEPMIQAPNVASRRFRPTSDGNFQWLHELHDLFLQHAEIEVPGNDPLMYAQTWFIHHERHRACRHPRGIRLDNVMITWMDILRQAWMDHLDPNLPFSVHIVRPAPPRTRWQEHACHILIEQAQQAHSAAGHLTIRYESTQPDRIALGMQALSLPSQLRLPDLIQASHSQPQCATRRCTARYGSQRINHVEAQVIPSGAGLKLIVGPPGDQLPLRTVSTLDEELPADSDYPFEPEAFALMQTTLAVDLHADPNCSVATHLPPGDAIDLPPAEPAELGRFQARSGLNILAGNFVPFSGNMAALSETMQDLYTSWGQHAASWEDEAPSATLATWFVDHAQDFPRCLQYRPVTLYDNAQDWEQQILRAWNDVTIDTCPHSFHLVTPQPPHLEAGIFAHLIVIQSERDEWVSNLVTIFDSFIGSRPQDYLRLVLTTVSQLYLSDVVIGCGYSPDSILPESLTPCQAWIDGHLLHSQRPWHARSAHCIILQVHRRVVVPEASLLTTDIGSLLQVSAVSASSRQPLCLDDLIPIESTCPHHCVPLKLRHLDDHPTIPVEVFLEDGFTAEDVETELAAWGHQRHVYPLASTGIAITVPVHWTVENMMHHYVYYPSIEPDAAQVILHSARQEFTELDHMSFLHLHGILRAVILSTSSPRSGLFLIAYHNNRPALETIKAPSKVPTSWPAPQPVRRPTAMIAFETIREDRPANCLSIGLSIDELHQYFSSADGVLCPWFTHLDLPDFVRTGIDMCISSEGHVPDLNQFDRLIIYTDGSSKPQHRRQPPLKVAEQGTPDAWAYVVLGEHYPTATSPGRLTFIGWQAQQIMYEADNGSFTGTDQIGAEFAEREALLFAGLWRLAINSTIPTIFRTDSSTTADQAAGRAGAVQEHPTHALLRGTFQALQSGLPSGDLLIEHVRGHTGDVWNELADFLAKTEAATGHHLQRHKIHLPSLKHSLPYLWMLFESQAGLPCFTHHGFDVEPPQLPPAEVPIVDSEPVARHPGRFSLSFASFNVGSLFVGPDGFSGKLSYIRQQAISHGLNVIGIQEARSPSGLSVAEQVLRISSGSENGHFGVELWVTLCQPYVYIDAKPHFFVRSHFQLLHHDARRIIVRVASPHLDAYFVVLHAPQSGRPFQERQQWWEATNALIEQHCHQFPIYVMIDANAKTGPCQEPSIFAQDDIASSSTPLLCDFLERHSLCLPSTCELHTGDQTTWTNPAGDQHHRIDYVAIPQQRLACCTWSGTVPSLDPGHAHFDHVAVAVQLEWHDQCIPSKPASRAPRHDRHQIRSQSASIDFDTIPVATWTCDIEKHVVQFNDSLHGVLSSACPFTAHSPKKSYIDADTWRLRSEKLHLRKRLKQMRLAKARDLLALAFCQWTRPYPEQCGAAWNHSTSVLCFELRLSVQYWLTSRRLKSRLQRARNQSLTQVILATGPDAAAGTILHDLKPFIGSTNPKKQKRACLPIVKKADGTLCATPIEAENRWIEHFQDMEGGTRMDSTTYRRHWLEGLTQFLQDVHIALPVQDLPSLYELEKAFRRVSLGKALGQDAIPPELCHYCPAQLAKLSYTMMLKAALYGQEAIEHKGGKLAVAMHELYELLGDSYADVVFGFLWAKLLKNLETTLVAHDVLEHIPVMELPDPYLHSSDLSHEYIPLLGPTWMDDLNIVLTATSNEALVSKAQFTLSVLIDACKSYQMEPNLSKGKTEVMFTFCGAHARTYRRQYYSDSAGLPIICERATHSVAVVSRYLHLGGVIHHRDVNKNEVARRFAIAKQAYQQHRRLLYRNRSIPWKVRCDLFQTLILSKLTYGFESWTFSTRQIRQQIHAGVMNLYRKLLGAPISAHLTDLEVLVQTNLPDPTELLRRARLRYFGTIHKCRQHAHWGVLREDHEWVGMLQDDLSWLWHQIKASTDLQDPQTHFAQWQDLIVHHGGYWKKLIRKGITHACMQRHKEHAALELHSRIGQLLLTEGYVERLPNSDCIAQSATDEAHFGCMCCQTTFASYAGEQVHMCRSHGHIARERFLFDGTFCPWLAPKLPNIAQRPEDPYDLTFFEAVYECLLAASPEVSLVEVLQTFIKAYPISWTSCHRTLTALVEQMTEDDAEPIAFSFEIVNACLRQLLSLEAWPFLQDEACRVVQQHPAALYDWELWCSDLSDHPPESWQTLQPLPQSLSRYKILLHAFAGRRRRGDVAWFLDNLASQCNGFVIVTVSIDIIIDPVHGDISKTEVRSFWLHYIRLGHVAGFLAGPPCNTWSRARAVAIADRPGPRIIRTPAEPWGLQNLRLGELQQITIGTILLGFSLECILALALHSGCGLVEHPRASEDDDAVSIWKLPIVHLILQLPQVRLIHVAQGLFGAPSPKPTTLLTLRLFSLEQCLHSGRLTKDLPFGLSTGRDESGNFHTAPLKEYPPGFCRSIARSFLDEFSARTCVDHGALPPSSFLDRCLNMQDHDFGAYIGKD
eukprot:s104_g13.t1